jgi:hypothetical protein
MHGARPQAKVDPVAQQSRGGGIHFEGAKGDLLGWKQHRTIKFVAFLASGQAGKEENRKIGVTG